MARELGSFLPLFRQKKKYNEEATVESDNKSQVSSESDHQETKDVERQPENYPLASGAGSPLELEEQLRAEEVVYSRLADRVASYCGGIPDLETGQPTASTGERLSNEELAATTQLLREQAESKLAYIKQLEALVRDKIKELSEREVASPQSAQALDAAFEPVATTMVEIRSSIVTVRSTIAALKERAGQHERLLLSGTEFSNFEDLENHARHTRDEIFDLDRSLFGAGRWIHRKQLAGLRQKNQQFESIVETHHQYKKDDLTRDNSKRLGLIFMNLSVDAAKPAIKPVVEHYERLLERTAESTGGAEPIELADQDIASLNRDFFDKEIGPGIKQAVASMQERGERIEDFDAVEEKIRGLLERCWASDSSPRMPPNPDQRAQYEALQQEVQALPYKLRELVDWQWKPGGLPRNGEYQRLADLLSKIEGEESRAVILRSFQRTREHFMRAEKPGSASGLRELSYLPTDQRDHDKNLSADMEHLDVGRWKALVAQRGLRERYGVDRLDQADRFVGRRIMRSLQESREHTDRSIKLGNRLLSFRDPETVPFAILNAYREPGYSGEQPFLSIHAQPEDTELCRYVKGLSDEQIAAVEAKNIPGLTDVIRLIREHPSSFRDDEYVDHERQPNPIRQEIHDRLKGVALHLFTTGDSREKRFSISTLSHLDVVVTDSDADRIFSQLYRTQDEEVIESAIQSIIDSERWGKPQLLEQYLRNYHRLDRSVKQTAKPYVIESCNHLLRGRFTPAVEEAAAEVMGISLEDFHNIRTLVTHLDKESGRETRVPSKLIPEYAALARNPNAIPLLELLKFYDCNFSDSELPTFAQLAGHMGDVEAVHARLQKIGFPIEPPKKHRPLIPSMTAPDSTKAESAEPEPEIRFPIQQPQTILNIATSPQRESLISMFEALHTQNVPFEKIDLPRFTVLLTAHPEAAPFITPRLATSLETLQYVLERLPADLSRVDLPLCDGILARFSGRGPELVRKFIDTVNEKSFEPADHSLAVELLERTGIIGPATLNGYKTAKLAGAEAMFEAKVRTMGEGMVSTEPMTDAERSDPLYGEIREYVYPNNAHQWYKIDSVERCGDRTQDLAGYRMREEYLIDIQPSSEMKIREGRVADEQLIERTQKKIAGIQEQFAADGFIPEKMQERVARTVAEHLATVGHLSDLDPDALQTTEEKLFAGLLESTTRGQGTERMRQLLLMYEFANFQDIRDYMQGTRDRVSQATTPDYALLGELHTFFSDELKHVIQTIAERGGEKLYTLMPKYFEAQQQRQTEAKRADKLNRVQLDKVGLTPGFLSQLERVLQQRGSKGKDFFLVREGDGGDIIGPKAEVLAGIIEGQQRRTASAIQALTGETIDPRDIHLGTVTLDRYLDSEKAIAAGTYDEGLFRSYLSEQSALLFGDDIAAIQEEMDKYEPVGSDRRRDRLRAVFSKTKESAFARAVGGVCVTADNPAAGKEHNMWDMPEYFQLVLQDPETKRSQGLVLLHAVQRGDERVLTASFNPSSTFVYTVNEQELFSQLSRVVTDFAADNGFDAVAVSTSKTIRTNRTGGQFERAIDERVGQQKERITLEPPAQFSHHPEYTMTDTDVIWRRPAASVDTSNKKV